MIAIYVEGGGQTASQRAELRQGFDTLLSDLKAKARDRQIAWKTVFAGSRSETYDTFMNAVRTNPKAVNALLVDSEDAVSVETGESARDANTRAIHLKTRDGWDFGDVDLACVHLMVRCMETWIVSDTDALSSYYGQHFKPNLLPRHKNLEELTKLEIQEKLEQATKFTGKGTYHKVKHARHLLGRISRERVSTRCPRFNTFRNWLNTVVDAF